MQCAVCGGDASRWNVVDGFDFTDCSECDCIAIAADAMASVDAGEFPRHYDPDYWRAELHAARERSFGPSMARMAESLLYNRRDVHRYLDIGTGPGYFLEAVEAYLPNAAPMFHGVEKFPPEERTNVKNFHIGSVGDLPFKFDGGICMEVIEHLTPTMLNSLVNELAGRSNDQALYIFNTGLSQYTRHEDHNYVDPLRRGHIVSWGLKALRDIFSRYEFKIWVLPGKTWAFIAEFRSTDETPLEHRIWNPTAHNRALLHDPKMGSVLYTLGLDTSRAYAR